MLKGTDDLQSGEVEYFSTHKMGNFLESGEFPRFQGTFDKIYQNPIIWGIFVGMFKKVITEPYPLCLKPTIWGIEI